jgi:glycosyltransferase involved in cell wall biosynthesis
MGGIETQINLISNFLSKYDPNLQFSLITDRELFLPFLHRSVPKHECYGNLKVFRLGPNIPKLVNEFSSVFQKKAKIQNRVYSRKLREIVIQRLFEEAKKIREVNGADVFHVHGLWGDQYELLAFRLSRFFEKPLIVHLRGMYLSGPEAMPLPDKLGMEILDHASAVITHNTNVFGKLKEWSLQNKSYLIPNAIDTWKFRIRKRGFAQRENPFNIAFVARLSAYRDPVTAIYAFKLLLEKIPEAKLHIAGKGPLEYTVQRLANQLGIGTSVVMYGSLRNIDSFLQKSDVFWSVSPINNYPSNSLMEALASSLPVVATDTGMTRELIVDKQNGLLISPRNPRELANATEEILTNKALRNSLSINASATAEKYDVKVIYPRIAQLYYSVSMKR